MTAIETEERPKVGIGLVIRNGSKVLLHRRLSEHAHGTWAFPGGHLEQFESFKEAAEREVEEEAGPDIRHTEPRTWHVINTVFKEEGRHYACIFLLCDYISGEAQVMEPDKCEKWEWFEWDDMPEPLIEGLRILKKLGQSPADVDYNALLPATNTE